MNRHDTWYSQITRVQYTCPLPHVLYTCYTSFSVLSYWRNRKSKSFPWQYLLIKHSSFQILTDITCPIHVSLATCICHVSYVFFYFIEGMENQNLFLGKFLIKHSSIQILTDITCPKQVSFALCLIEGMGNHNLFL